MVLLKYSYDCVVCILALLIVSEDLLSSCDVLIISAVCILKQYKKLNKGCGLIFGVD